MSDIIKELEKEQLRTDLPELEIGDQVRVYVKVVEGTHERLQNFEGIVIKMEGGGIRKSFTVRRISYGVGVERTFPYHSPPHRPHRGGPSRRRPPREALLPPGAFRQGCQDPRAHRHQVKKCPAQRGFFHGATRQGREKSWRVSVDSWHSQFMGACPIHLNDLPDGMICAHGA